MDIMEYKIPLRNIKKEIVNYSFVSEEDYENVIQYKWHLRKTECKLYVQGRFGNTNISLHHFIFGKPKKGYVVDHINGNGLDNQRHNLRFANRSQNSQNNRKDQSNSASKYLGVTKSGKTWAASSSGKNMGTTFKTEIEAAKAYDRYVYALYGQHAKTNNLIAYEDCKDLDANDLVIKDRNKKSKLPKHVFFHTRDKKYFCNIRYNFKTYSTTYRLTLKEAEEDLIDLLKKIDDIKADELKNYNEQPIQRNAHGCAVIKTTGKNAANSIEVPIDDEIWHKLSLIKWNRRKDGYIQGEYEGKTCYMHHVVMKLSNIEVGEGNVIDHINRVRHDNRMCNLRIASHHLNSHNKSKPKNSVSKYIGVSLDKRRNTWFGSITQNNKSYNLGNYDMEVKAAIAYNLKAIELYGDCANLNDISEEDMTLYADEVKNYVIRPKREYNYNGISYLLSRDWWTLYVTKSILYFRTEIEAAIAYNIFVLKTDGPKNTLNNIPQEYLDKYEDGITTRVTEKLVKYPEYANLLKSN